MLRLKLWCQHCSRLLFTTKQASSWSQKPTNDCTFQWHDVTGAYPVATYVGKKIISNLNFKSWKILCWKIPSWKQIITILKLKRIRPFLIVQTLNVIIATRDQARTFNASNNLYLAVIQIKAWNGATPSGWAGPYHLIAT